MREPHIRCARDIFPKCDKILGAFGVKRIARVVIWVVVAILGAGALAKIAFDRGESLNAMWFVIAAVKGAAH